MLSLELAKLSLKMLHALLRHLGKTIVRGNFGPLVILGLIPIWLELSAKAFAESENRGSCILQEELPKQWAIPKNNHTGGQMKTFHCLI